MALVAGVDRAERVSQRAVEAWKIRQRGGVDRTGGCSHGCAPMACEPEFGDDGAPPQDVSEEGWGAALGDGAGAIYAPQLRQ